MIYDRLSVVADTPEQYSPPPAAPDTEPEPSCQWAEDSAAPACGDVVRLYIGGIPYCNTHGSAIYRTHVLLYPDRDIDIKMRRIDCGVVPPSEEKRK